jgi:glyoxylase-like metal-dependent hydrolase (beta-lactamase superfamily II)
LDGPSGDGDGRGTGIGEALAYRQTYACVAFDYDCAIAVTKDISPRIHRLGTPLVNWYFVEDRGELTAVDGGLPGFKRTLAADLAMLGFGLKDVRAVILTHSDGDHTGVADELHESGARVLIHAADEPKLRKPGPKSGDAKAVNIVPEMWRPSLWRAFGSLLLAGGARPAKINDAETFTEGVLDVPGRPRVIPTPGHTPGHCAFHFEEHSALFVGDAMATLNMITLRTGPQLMPRPLNESNAETLRSLDPIEPIDAEIMLFGHGEPWRDGVGAAVAQARTAAQG